MLQASILLILAPEIDVGSGAWGHVDLNVVSVLGEEEAWTRRAFLPSTSSSSTVQKRFFTRHQHQYTTPSRSETTNTDAFSQHSEQFQHTIFEMAGGKGMFFAPE